MIRLLFSMMLALLLSACVSSTEKSSDNNSQEELQVKLQKMDEMLSTIQSELNKTSNNVADLKQTIDSTLKANQPPPPPSVLEISFDDDPVLGNENAKIAIVEFSDFQCPYCAEFHQRYFPSIKQDYIDTGKVKFIYRDLALDFHPEAENAAIAANCAGEQDAYYKMHDLLFQNQKILNRNLYEKLAEKLNLNKDDFTNCYKHKRQKQEVRADLAEARKIGISGTPAFFVGRVQGNKIVDVKFMEGAQTPLAFSRLIDSLMEKEEVASISQ